MAEISTNKRDALPDESFALPSKRKYPIHDEIHVRNAAARLAQAKRKGKISDEDHATAHAAIDRAEKRFGIKSGDTATDRPRRHHFAITADLAHGGELHITHASLRDTGGVAYLPPRPVTVPGDS